MAALTGPRLARETTIKRFNWPLAGSVKAFIGGVACADTSAAVIKPGAAGNANLLAIGVFEDNNDNSASTATAYCWVTLTRELDCLWLDNATGAGNVTTANLFQNCYMADDHTVTMSTGSGNAVAGRIWDIDASRGVLVQFNQY